MRRHVIIGRFGEDDKTRVPKARDEVASTLQLVAGKRHSSRSPHLQGWDTHPAIKKTASGSLPGGLYVTISNLGLITSGRS